MPKQPKSQGSYDDGHRHRVGDDYGGTVEVLRSYYASESFNVLNVREIGGRKLNIVGSKVLQGILPGSKLDIKGTWVRSKYGMQVDVHHVTIVSFDPNAGFVESLLSHCVKDERERLDPILREIVRIHGDGAREILMSGTYGGTDEERRCARRLADVLEIKEQKDRRMAMLARLHRLGLSGPVAERMWTAFWDDAVDVLEAFPHEVALEIPGIPFSVADRIAFTHGVEYDPFTRIKTVVRHACDLASENGHCFVDRDILVEGVLRILASSPTTGIPPGEDPTVYVQRAISSSEGSGIVVMDSSRRVYPYACDEAEEVIARNVAVRMSSRSRGRTGLHANPDRLVEMVTADAPVEYSPEQVMAVRAALDNPLSIITGGPGTGKTTVCRAIVRCFESAGLRVSMCSPTGRGAKRLAESVDRDASTIHRLLEYRPDDGTWGRNCLDQIGAGAVIVDEVSMVDVHLLRALLDAMPGVARVVFVGDSDQLPSIGPGRVLWDMMDSGCVPTTVLSTIFRQSGDNDLVPVSHAVRTGGTPSIPSLSRPVSVDVGCWMSECSDPISARDSIHGLMVEIGTAMGIDPGDVQVLTPMRIGPLGTVNLNLVLQEALNPQRPGDRECRWGGSTFRIGDKVMQTRNDAHSEVYNGDMGVVVEIARSGIAIDFQGIGEVGYAGSQLESIEHCWAVTCHKSQGSEFDAGIVIMHDAHRRMLRRNLLYTALTRFSKLAVVVGKRSAVRQAVLDAREQVRCTTLGERIRRTSELLGSLRAS